MFGQRALLALGRAGDADLHAVLDQPLMGVALVVGGRLGVDDVGGFRSRGRFHDAQAVENAQNVRVDRDTVLREREVHHDVGALAPDTLQLHQLIAVFGDFAAVFLDDLASHLLQVLGLAVVVRHRLDDAAQLVVIKLRQFLKRRDPFVKRHGGVDDALGDRHGGQAHGHQALERRCGQSVGHPRIVGFLKRRVGLAENVVDCIQLALVGG